MDTSKDYIKMCERAVEIQKEWVLREGDCLWCKKYLDIFYVSTHSRYKSSSHIFLPRQDQLQKMVNENNLTALLQDFISWLSKQCNLPMHNTSMEQLWLAFVMKEKYNKTWDGKEWE